MNKRHISILSILSILSTEALFAHTITGRVSRVIDGDTIIIEPSVPSRGRSSNGIVRIRLADIDAPEMKTEYGPAAKMALEKMVSGKTVVVEWKHRGRYGRIIGKVYLQDENVSHSLVAQGFARRYARTSRTSTIASLEKLAREQAKGLWARNVPSQSR